MFFVGRLAVVTALGACSSGGAMMVPADGSGSAPPSDAGVDTPDEVDPNLPPDPATVAPPLDRSVATSLPTAVDFLYTGEHPIQTGVDPAKIDSRRIAVLRGRVAGRNGAPVRGATVTVLGHPELGQTLTRMDGGYDLVANGGDDLVVSIRKDGFLPAQRTVNVPWQDYVPVPEIVLLRPDPAATPIDLAAAGMQVARGSTVTDASGSRRATLIVQPGTHATVATDTGTETLPRLTVHLTEFTEGPTGPAAMPGSLPPTSAYTYAVEITVDEAAGRSVELSQPALLYVENFLGFAPGTGMPVGAYDPARGTWSGIPNGIVLKIVSISNGAADLDTDGDGAADSAVTLASLGVTDLERQILATTYTTGQSLWRSSIPHFSSFDCNRPLRLPGDARFPGLRDPRAPGGDGVDDGCHAGGSIIECHNQALGEDLPINGSSYFLHYQSDRQAGRRTDYSVDIAISDDHVPASVAAISLEVAIAGRTVTQRFPPTPNQHTVFTWDGKDAYGRVVQGRATASIALGYIYRPSYADPVVSGNQFAQFPPSAIDREASSIPGREDVTLFQRWKTQLGPFDALAQGLGGLSISPQHTYDVVGKILHTGNGDTRRANTLGQTEMNRVFFTSLSGDRFDRLDVSARPDGSFLIVDGQHRMIVDASNRVVAGVLGAPCQLQGGDEGPATKAQLCSVKEVLAGRDESVYFADAAMIRKITPDGILHTIAGKPFTGPLFMCVISGIGGPAKAAQVCDPREFSLASDGALYFRVPTHAQIFKIGGDGYLSVIAGTGVAGFSGDGGPALQATLSDDLGLAVGPDGSIVVADRGNNRIRRISVDGVITTIAGTGLVDDGGDGGPATGASFRHLSAVAVAADGTIYVGDTGASRYRVIGAQGTISEFAGGGPNPGGDIPPFPADGQQPTDVAFFNPVFVTVGPDAQVYLGENRSVGLVYRVGSALPAYSVTEHVIPSPSGGELYVFDQAGRHLRTLDSNTGAIQLKFAYDDSGRLLSITDLDSRITRIERNAAGEPTAIVAPFGQRTVLAVNQDGYLRTLTDPAGAGYALSYGAGGLLSSLTDPLGGLHAFTYDDLGRLVTDKDPGQATKTLSRAGDATDSTVTLTTELGRTTSYRIERPTSGDEIWTNTLTDGTNIRIQRAADGSVTSSYPDGSTATQKLGPDPRFGLLAPVPIELTLRTPAGLVQIQSTSRAVTLADARDLTRVRTATETFTLNGKSFTRTFDAVARTVTIRSPLGRQTVATLDDRGRMLSVAGISAQPVQLSYDGSGHATALGHGERKTTLTYRGDGRAATVSDALGAVAYDRDAAGRVLATHWADDGADSYTFHPLGGLTGLTTPGGSSHGFEHDVLGQVRAYVAPDAGPNTRRTAFTYDAAHQMTSVTDPDGATAAIAYDTAGRPSRVTLPEGALEVTYDAGRLATIAAPGNVGVAISYDGSLPTTTTWTGPVAGAVHIEYDNDFRVASERVNGEPAIAVSYDDDGLATHVGALTLTRDPATGRVTQAAVGQVAESYTFNDLGELSGSSATCGGAPLRTSAVTRNAGGAISTISEAVAGQTIATTYERDRAGRLTRAHDGVRDTTYTYDRSGNRLSSSRLPTIIDTHDAQDRLTQHGATTYAYNGRGQLSSKADAAGTTAYHYDLLGNLRSVQLPNGSNLGYVVDGMNRRIGRTVNGALTQGLLYDSKVNIVAEIDAGGGVVSRFVYGSRRNAPDYMIRGGSTFRILGDHAGSPRLVVDIATCQVVQRIDYDEFGRVLVDTNPGFQPFGFAGGLLDRDTGLVRFGARDYDPETGRWTAKDPAGFHGGDSNLYAYAANDPITFIDPTGLSFMQGLTDFFAGFGDTITFGGTRWVRRKLGVDSVVNPCSGWYTTGGVAALVVTTVATSGVGAAAEDGAVATRGISKFGGIFSRSSNAAGGEVWTSVGGIAQQDFATIVNSGLMKGSEVKILSGVHGLADGGVIADAAMFNYDAATLGQIEGVTVLNVAEMSPSAISSVVNGPGTIIGGFCNSGACLAPFLP